MNQLRSIYASLSPKQRGSIALICLALIAGFFYISRWQHERGFEPLYKELAGEDASAVVAKLKERGVEFRLAENGSTVLVPSDKAAEMRLEMAGAGLVRSGRPGFELFDKVNFGVTDFAEQVNFRRALEGELERSVVSLAEVEKARIHLTFKRESVYTETRQPAKASVLVKLKPFAKLSPQNVQAIAHLVSSAVEGLSPDAVSILDMNGNLLGRPRRTPTQNGEEASDYALEYQQAVEKQLLAKINSTLEPLLGPDRFRAGVSVDCDLSSSDESEEVFDPERSVMTSSQKSEDSSSHTPAGGVPGTASALPRPNDAAKGQAGTSRKTESVAYQTSRKVVHRRTPQGVVRRVSVSLLLDNDVEWQGQGANRKKVIVPPTPERVKSIHDLVAGVVGFSQERGDQIVLEVLPFEMNLHGDPLADQAPAPAPAKDWKQRVTNVVQDPKQLVPLSAILATIFVLGVGAWQFKRYKAKKARKHAVLHPLPALPSGGGHTALTEAMKEQQALEAEELDPVGRLLTLVEEKPEQCAVVLKQWLAEQEVGAS
ncbi:flagellar basal-body MS-ring/collar protein FliF [uncultured Paludibaculum sp.]|uniref:flagellar basal-body MS-ring/collar protein FliF n=1 Tax=uncultured Paludibaculum sp. TaxID=1765020 RepID=UPI002AAB287E|nr:flagellar basal-body MS-ring/collar protein FliF [uncultured Paludibaculum sp.]